MITLSNGVLSTSATGNLQWYYGLFSNTLQPISGATNQEYVPTQNGYYSVVLTDANGCSAMSNKLQVLGVGISEIQAEAFQIYPSITADYFRIEGLAANDLIVIQDLSGRNIQTLSYTQKQSIDVSSLQAGVYLVSAFRNGMKIHTAKLIKTD
jgi:hypothetical protein